MYREDRDCTSMVMCSHDTVTVSRTEEEVIEGIDSEDSSGSVVYRLGSKLSNL